MANEYKACAYQATIHHEAETDEVCPWNNRAAYDTYETRYRIVSTETGEILDDAQGYGYKTAQKAYAAYGYKTRDKSKDKGKISKTKHIKQWMKEHKSFVELMNTIAFEIAKGSWGPDYKFDAALVRKMLEENELEPDFTAGELLNVWKNTPWDLRLSITGVSIDSDGAYSVKKYRL